MRDKLVELIEEAAIQYLDAYANAGKIADFLIANGVTFADVTEEVQEQAEIRNRALLLLGAGIQLTITPTGCRCRSHQRRVNDERT